ncbi:MAG: serine/threonine protein kinase [Fibrobacteria bacterium]|nr:serine/threonine protein kinase [Fibrobacteria bacterium]
MASVFMAEDAQLRRAVALKVMHSPMAADAEWARRFHQEATTVARLSHHRIVQVLDSGTQDGQEFLVMEFLDRGSFGRILQANGGRLDPRTVACVALQAAEGLAAAHEAGVVHRDVKPDNILLNRQGTAKVADFGISRIQNDISHTQAGQAMGSPQYMAPEQIEGGELGGWTDVFALGGLIHGSIAGSLPFQAETVHAMLMKIVTADPPDLRTLEPSCPRVLADLVRTMLRKRGRDRPTMEDVARSLRSWLASHEILDAAEYLRTTLHFPQTTPLGGSTTAVTPRLRRRPGWRGWMDRLRKAARTLVGEE